MNLSVRKGYLRQINIGVEQKLFSFTKGVSLLRRLFYLISLTILIGLVGQHIVLADGPLVEQEFRYHNPEATEVYLIWGINGWKTAPQELHPPETSVDEDGVMSTRLTRNGDDFVTTIQLPAGSVVDYGFWGLTSKSSEDSDFWDSRESVFVFQPDTLVSQEVRYYLPGAEEVFLVWTINGGGILPEAYHPAATEAKDDAMHTTMVRQGDTFIARIQAPAALPVDNAFLITKTRNERETEIWDYPSDNIVPAPGGVHGVYGTTELEEEASFNLFTENFYFAIGVMLVAFVGILLYRSSLNKLWGVRFVLFGFILVGLGLRLWIIQETTFDAYGDGIHLTGHELAVDRFARVIWRGADPHWAGQAPLYPLFVALSFATFGDSHGDVFILQAILGTLTIPLTYLLARQFTGIKLALFAAFLISLHPGFILQSARLSIEVLFVPLLLAILGLIHALQTLQQRHFMIAGLLMAITFLSHPTVIFFPILLPLFLPHMLNFRRKVTLFATYVTSMFTLIIPWMYFCLFFAGTLPLLSTPTALWQGSSEFYHRIEQQQSMAEIWNDFLNPAQNGGYDPDRAESRNYFNDRALESIKAEPGIYAWYSSLKFVFFWFGHPTFDWPNYAVFDIEAWRPFYPPFVAAGIFMVRLLPAFALYGLIILHVVHDRLGYAVPLIAVCLYFMVIHVITYPEIRFSEPLHPILITIIMMAVKPQETVLPEETVNTSTGFYYAQSEGRKLLRS